MARQDEREYSQCKSFQLSDDDNMDEDRSPSPAALQLEQSHLAFEATISSNNVTVRAVSTPHKMHDNYFHKRNCGVRRKNLPRFAATLTTTRSGELQSSVSVVQSAKIHIHHCESENKNKENVLNFCANEQRGDEPGHNDLSSSAAYPSSSSFKSSGGRSPHERLTKCRSFLLKEIPSQRRQFSPHLNKRVQILPNGSLFPPVSEECPLRSVGDVHRGDYTEKDMEAAHCLLRLADCCTWSEGSRESPHPASPVLQLSNKKSRPNLPKQAVEVLYRHFRENLQFPYPSEEEKYQLARRAELQLRQVDDWLVNSRRRKWRQWLVEDGYSEKEAEEIKAQASARAKKSGRS